MPRNLGHFEAMMIAAELSSSTFAESQAAQMGLKRDVAATLHRRPNPNSNPNPHPSPTPNPTPNPNPMLTLTL